MNDLDDWARNNLSSDGQNKFFAEQKNIAEDWNRLERCVRWRSKML